MCWPSTIPRTLVPPLALSVLVCALAGCQSTQSATPPIREDDPLAVSPAAGETATSPMTSLRYSPNLPLRALVRQTDPGDGRDFDPDISADGAWLAFASTRDGDRPAIYLKHANEPTVVSLTDGGHEDIQPRFSPDGARIAFASRRSGKWDLWVLNIDGGELTQVTHNPADEIAPVWSPDGGRIAFNLWNRLEHRWEIWILETAAPGVRQFVTEGLFPVWSPDGTQLAFQRRLRESEHSYGIWRISVTGGPGREPILVARSDRAACVAPLWAPDGGWIAYFEVETPGSWSTDGRAGRGLRSRLAAVSLENGWQARFESDVSGFINGTWSADGRVFLCGGDGGREAIWASDAVAAMLAARGETGAGERFAAQGAPAASWPDAPGIRTGDGADVSEIAAVTGRTPGKGIK